LQMSRCFNYATAFMAKVVMGILLIPMLD